MGPTKATASMPRAMATVGAPLGKQSQQPEPGDRQRKHQKQQPQQPQPSKARKLRSDYQFQTLWKMIVEEYEPLGGPPYTPDSCRKKTRRSRMLPMRLRDWQMLDQAQQRSDARPGADGSSPSQCVGSRIMDEGVDFEWSQLERLVRRWKCLFVTPFWLCHRESLTNMKLLPQMDLNGVRIHVDPRYVGENGCKLQLCFLMRLFATQPRRSRNSHTSAAADMDTGESASTSASASMGAYDCLESAYNHSRGHASDDCHSHPYCQGQGHMNNHAHEHGHRECVIRKDCLWKPMYTALRQHQTQLRKLSLSNCDVIDPAMSEWLAQNIQSLSISRCRFQDDGRALCEQLVRTTCRLRELHLNCLTIDADHLVRAMQTMHTVRAFGIESLAFVGSRTGSIDRIIRAVVANPHIQQLSLSGNAEAGNWLDRLLMLIRAKHLVKINYTVGASDSPPTAATSTNANGAGSARARRRSHVSNGRTRVFNGAGNTNGSTARAATTTAHALLADREPATAAVVAALSDNHSLMELSIPGGILDDRYYSAHAPRILRENAIRNYVLVLATLFASIQSHALFGKLLSSNTVRNRPTLMYEILNRFNKMLVDIWDDGRAGRYEAQLQLVQGLSSKLSQELRDLRDIHINLHSESRPAVPPTKRRRLSSTPNEKHMAAVLPYNLERLHVDGHHHFGAEKRQADAGNATASDSLISAWYS